ncbi:MAG TPA: DNA polymerase I [Clostridiales bacterium]|nr:DNA polymerase I [Clostridiales bacterium]
MKKVLLIDGNNILHRAYHGLPLLKTKDGRYTNAVYGFLKMLQKILEQENPTHVAICFDKGKNTFRHRKYPAYKAQRKPLDPELLEQMPLIREVLDWNGYICLDSEEYEADDLIGTLAVKTAEAGDSAVIFSGDKDLLQVLGDRVSVVSGKKQLTDLVKTDENAFREKYGIAPLQLIDVKGLMGDASDNIPGVMGVGEKTALKLITAYDSVENLYAHIDELPQNKMKEKLVNDKDMAFLSKDLATVITDVPLNFSWDELIPQDKKIDELKTLYRDLEFRSLLRELNDLKEQGASAKAKQSAALNGSLFDLADVKEKPFDLKMVGEKDKLPTGQTVGVCLDNDQLYLATADKTCCSFSRREQAAEIAAVLSDGQLKKQCADLKLLYHYCFEHQIVPAGIAGAVEMMAYLDDSNCGSYQLSALADRYFNYDTFLFGEEKTAAEAALILPLTEELTKRLAEKDCLALYRDVELPLVKVLADMEYRGIRVDKETLKQMSVELGEQLAAIAQRIYEYAGETFNLNSPKQMSVVLFEKMALQHGKKTKTGYSTNNEVLESLRDVHPIIEEILNYRQLSKLKSTYTDALEKLISDKTGHIHTKFLQTVTTTGRLSSADPNLQNIPIRVEEGRKIRKAFTASDEDHILLAADYSQIELRLLAHFAADPVLIDSFIHNEDIHTRTAGEIFDVPMEQVNRDMRRTAKVVNFGIIYGISSYGLSNDLGTTRKVAQEYIDGYFARYPNVKKYLDGTVSEAREKGYATTLMNRRRYLPDLYSKNFNLRSFAERTAMNTPLQGSAADIIKLVMVKLYAALKDGGYESRMILQVHDELIIDCRKDEFDRVKVLLKDLMEHTVPLKVPLTVDMKAGNDWYQMEKINRP